MTNPADTNQASEELRSKIKTAQFDLVGRRATHIQVARRSGWTPSELDGVHEGDHIIFENDILTLIRTEKLKLLAEVRERVVGENTSYQSATTEELVSPFHLYQGKNALRSEQIESLTKLEAEL